MPVNAVAGFAQTLYQIERLKRDRHRLAVGRKVGVVDFAA